MNLYEAKQAERRERYEARADATRKQAVAVANRAQQMADVIPFGQPILVGHHSEGADRRYRARIQNGFAKSFHLQDQADHYQQKAAAVGTGGISGDDPDASEKLKAQLVRLQARQDLMKKVNAAIRHNRADAAAQIDAIVSLGGFTESQAGELIQPDFAGRVGFASYQLANNNANIRRIAARIKGLERAQDRAPVERLGDGFTYREDPEENRAMFLFDGKPDKAVRGLLKRHGFRWSPTRSAWVRQLTGNAQWAAQQVMRDLTSAQ